jgi:hypothetical protein
MDTLARAKWIEAPSGAVLHGPVERPMRSRVVQVQGEDLLAEA